LKHEKLLEHGGNISDSAVTQAQGIIPLWICSRDVEPRYFGRGFGAWMQKRETERVCEFDA